jgi:hypothetical protein
VGEDDGDDGGDNGDDDGDNGNAGGPLDDLTEPFEVLFGSVDETAGGEDRGDNGDGDEEPEPEPEAGDGGAKFDTQQRVEQTAKELSERHEC